MAGKTHTVCPLLFLFDDGEEGGGGGVEDADLRTADRVAVKRGEVFVQSLALGVALGVPRIDCDQQHAAVVEQVDRRLDGGHGGDAHGGDALIAAGQVAKVEHTCADGGVHVLPHLVVGVQDQRIILGASRRREVSRGGVQRLLLDVEGEDVSRFADRLRQERGVVSVAHGEVHRNVALAQVIFDKLLLQLQQVDHIAVFCVTHCQRCPFICEDWRAGTPWRALRCPWSCPRARIRSDNQTFCKTSSRRP